MENVLSKIKESLFSVLPVVLFVIGIVLTSIVYIEKNALITFIISSVLLIIGMALFNIGAEISMTTMGEMVGVASVKTKNIIIILLIGLTMGILVTIAEPDLTVLSDLLAGFIDKNVFVIFVGIGVGVFLSISIAKVIFNKTLSSILLLFYMLIFALCAILFEQHKGSFIPLSFDSGGVTTGPITVPFLMSFGLGIATTIGGKNVNENSFGFVSLCSVGPILIMLFVSLLSSNSIDYVLGNYSYYPFLSSKTITIFINEGFAVFKVQGLILLFFFVLNFFIIHLPLRKILQIIFGTLITFVGLTIFLSASSIGYLTVGFNLGKELSNKDLSVVCVICMIIGMLVVLAEPAVAVLNRQVEDITQGNISKKSLLIALSIGVGLALTLSAIRIYFKFSLLYYLVPGYFISLALSLFVPPLYTSIAFDSGGVASGPLTSTFILPIMIGTCSELIGESEVVNYGFGVVALVAMAPLISIQVLGFKAIATKKIKDRVSMGRIMKADDNQIIYFVLD